MSALACAMIMLMLGLRWVTPVRFGKIADALSFAYLALPLLIFILAWMNLAVAAIGVITLGAATWLYIKTLQQEAFVPKISFNKTSLGIAVGVIITWVFISGIGGLAPQVNDFNKHNAIMNDLVDRSWPVTYNFEGENVPLVYYVAWYLPAATVGKAVNSSLAADYFLLLWSVIGVLLIFYWLSRLVGKSSLFLALFFVGFSGLDVVGALITQNADNSLPLITRGAELEWYTGVGNLEYAANTTSLFWVPQHAIAGWLLASMLCAIFVERRRRDNALPLAAIGVLWSPFAVVGLAPIFISFLLSGKDRIKALLAPTPLIIATIIGLSLMLFFRVGSSQQFGTFLDYGYISYPWQKALWLLVLFIILEVGLYISLIHRHIMTNESKEWRILFMVTTGFLLVLPFFRLGLYNDLVMRASIPSLLILSLLIFRFLDSSPTLILERKKQQLVSVALGIALIGSFIAFNTHTLSADVPVDTWKSISNQELPKGERDIMNQYVGNPDAIYYRYLMKQEDGQVK